MKSLKLIRLIVPCAVLALMPATLRLFGQGIHEETIEVDDCIVTGGKMGTELIAGADPETLNIDDLPKEVMSDSAELHAHFSLPEATIDATESAEVSPKLEFAPGSDMGNADQNTRKFETKSPWSKSPAENAGELEIDATCLDCDSGDWNVDLLQSVTVKITANWEPAEVTTPGQPPLGVQDQKPEWELYVAFEGIGGESGSLRLEAEVSESGIVASSADPVGAPETFTISENGESPQDGGTYWTESWNPDAGYSVTAKSTWLLTKNYAFSCAETAPTGPDVQEDLEVKLTWDMSIEDKTDPDNPFSYTEGVLSSIATNLKYSTMIWISRINVTRNCDATVTDCPCVRHPD